MKPLTIFGLTIFAILAFFAVLAFGAKPQPVGPSPPVFEPVYPVKPGGPHYPGGSPKLVKLDSFESQQANTLVLMFDSGPVIVNLPSILPGNLPVEDVWHKCHVMKSFDPPYFYVNKLFGFLRIRWDGSYYDILLNNDELEVFAVRADIQGRYRFWLYKDSHTWREVCKGRFWRVIGPLCKDTPESCKARGFEPCQCQR